MKFFDRVDKIVSTLALHDVTKSEGDVSRKLVKVLTDEYEIEQRTLLYRDEKMRAKIENIVQQRHLSLPVSKGKNVGQALFSSGVGRGGRGGGRGGSRGGGRGYNRNNGRSRNKGSANAETSEVSEGSNNPPPQRNQSPKQSTIRFRACVSVAWIPDTCGTIARLTSPRLRRGRLTGVNKDRTTAVKLCTVLRTLCLV